MVCETIRTFLTFFTFFQNPWLFTFFGLLDTFSRTLPAVARSLSMSYHIVSYIVCLQCLLTDDYTVFLADVSLPRPACLFRRPEHKNPLQFLLNCTKNSLKTHPLLGKKVHQGTRGRQSQVKSKDRRPHSLSGFWSCNSNTSVTETGTRPWNSQRPVPRGAELRLLGSIQ